MLIAASTQYQWLDARKNPQVFLLFAIADGSFDYDIKMLDLG